MGFRLRMSIWIPTLAYAGLLLLGGKNLASLGRFVATQLGSAKSYRAARCPVCPPKWRRLPTLNHHAGISRHGLLSMDILRIRE